MSDSSVLYIVPTPIGNLSDITRRAIEILSQVDLIAAEDTRHSQKLLQHYDIETRLISLHDHNEGKRAKQLIEQLQQGLSVALISDAGTPLISDPGYGLVSSCRQQGIRVVPLPGPCAAITALSGAGLPTDRFVFEGFLPVKEGAKQRVLQRLENETATCVFYESPRRVVDSLHSIMTVLGGSRTVVLAKELSKTFETFFSGTAKEAHEWLLADDNHQRGEFVLMLAGVEKVDSDIPDEAIKLLIMLREELPLKKAAAITAHYFDLKKNALYQKGLELEER